MSLLWKRYPWWLYVSRPGPWACTLYLYNVAGVHVYPEPSAVSKQEVCSDWQVAPQLKAGPLVSRNPPLPSLLDSGTFSHEVDPTCHRLETVTLDLTAGAPSISATSQSRTFSPPKNPRPLVRPLTDSGAHAVGPLGQWPLTPPSSCSARRTPFIRLRPPSRRPHKNPTAASKTLASPSPPP